MKKRKIEKTKKVGIMSLLFIFLTSCYSTSFVPPADGKMYLVIKNNKMYAYKNGPLGSISDFIPDDFCDKNAVENAKEAKEKYESAQSLRLLAYIIDAASIPLILIFPLLGITTETISNAILFSAAEKEQEAYRLFINSINQHNDNPECIGETKKN